MKHFGKMNHGPIPKVIAAQAKTASDQRQAADGSLEPSAPALVVAVPDAPAEAFDIESDVDSIAPTLSESSNATDEGDAVDPPSADDEWGDGKFHPCRLCKNMTLSNWDENWGPVLGSFCSRLCHDQWMANIEEARAVDKLSYENRAEEITITTYPDQDEDELRQCGYCLMVSPAVNIATVTGTTPMMEM